ncbi:PIN domain-containing protein [Candidatus Daviesbacteria bacterium]|nr:PIN domain-containing protein [Candidatus Daviesbacteria bacterium]
MTFVDTNYFLRFLLNDIDSHYQQSKELFLKAARGELELITSVVVFFEVAWVLEASYGQDRDSLTEALYKILTLSLNIENRDLLFEVLHLFRNTTLEIEDCYNLLYAKKLKVEDFRTFDDKLEKQFAKV